MEVGAPHGRRVVVDPVWADDVLESVTGKEERDARRCARRCKTPCPEP
jgi:hypothetical protein